MTNTKSQANCPSGHCSRSYRPTVAARASLRCACVQASANAGAPAFVDAWTCAHGDAARAPTVGVYDHEQWADGPFACDFIFVTEDLGPRVTRCEVDPHSQSSDHQPMWLELR